MTRRGGAVAVAVLVAVVGLVAGLVLLGRSGGGSEGSAGSSAYPGDSDAGLPDADVAAAPAAGGAAVANGAQSNGAAAVTRDVVRTASLAVTVDDPADTADHVVAVAQAQGGRVDSDVRGGAGDAAQLVVRVPAAALDATLTGLAALGEVTGRQVTGEDVTARTADLGARVSALQTGVERLRTLVGTSGNLSDLLAVETQLTQRQSDLEALQAQQRALADQVALADVTVDLSAPAPPAAAATGPAGFGSAAADGWRGFVLVLRWLVAVLGYLLPVLALAAVAVGVAVGVRRRRRAGTAAR